MNIGPAGRAEIYLNTFHVTQRKVNIMMNAIRRFVKEEEGASAAEYALLLAIITLGIVGAVQLLGTNVSNAINQAAAVIQPGGGS